MNELEKKFCILLPNIWQNTTPEGTQVLSKYSTDNINIVIKIRSLQW